MIGCNSFTVSVGIRSVFCTHLAFGIAVPNSQCPGGPGGRGRRDLERILEVRTLPARTRATNAPRALNSNAKSSISNSLQGQHSKGTDGGMREKNARCRSSRFNVDKWPASCVMMGD